MNKTIIIAEAGVNHNGNIAMAYKLIDVAVNAGADYVKFQTYKTENLVDSTAEKAEYQKHTSGKNESQYEMLKRLELPFEEHKSLKRYAETKGIKFLSTGFDDESLDFLNELGIDFFKIPSGDAVNHLYLKKVASFSKPIVLSTGMCTMEEVKKSVEVLTNCGIHKSQITILHCNSQYPSPYEDLNLSAMHQIKFETGCKVGYSDHTTGFEASIAALALGAVVIEKHFTLDKNLEGPDHSASLAPNELVEFISQLRKVELALGMKEKVRSKSEAQNIIPARKSLYYKTNLNKGHAINEKDLMAKRPGDGISASELEKVIGKRTRNNVFAGSKLKWEDLG